MSNILIALKQTVLTGLDIFVKIEENRD